MILSNIAIFNSNKSISNLSGNLLKYINFDESEISEYLISASNDIDTFGSKSNDNLGKYNIPITPELKSRFLSFIALYAENILQINQKDFLLDNIQDYFNKIISGIYHNNDPSSIGYQKNAGFSLALVKLRAFLLKSKPVDKLKNINSKILRTGLSFIDPKTKFVNTFFNDFDKIYENLNIKYNEVNKTFLAEPKKMLDNNFINELLTDFYDYKNTIYLQSFFFYDHLSNYLDNYEKIPMDYIDTMNTIVDHVISCCDLKTDKNYLGSSVKKNSGYLMKFIINDQLNTMQKDNSKVEKLMNNFWKMLYHVIKNDEENIICSK
jgi:hypothetical protein